MSSKLLFASLRTSLFTALGLGVAACGGSEASEVDPPDAGDAAPHASDTEAGFGGAEDGDAPAILCEDPVEILDDGRTTGFFRCADGTRYRVEAVEIAPKEVAGSCKGTEGYRSCSKDADCSRKPYGRCLTGIDYGPRLPEEKDIPPTRCDCQYGCASDADCQENEACIPRGVVPGRLAFCAPAACKTGADCESGECGLSIQDNDGCMNQAVRLGCRGVKDECRVDSECEPNVNHSPPVSVSDQCLSDGSRFRCMGVTCVIGRPLLVDGSARTAPPVSRDDWAAGELLPDVSALDPALRKHLADHWLEVAAMEHASVGSFARFSLELLALGAPPDLLAETQRAALDEVEHARIAYGVASAYAGKKLGPGPLDPAGIDLTKSRREVMRSLIFEACVSETLGVAEALFIAETVSDPALAAVFRRIAEDEERHAALAWRTLAWLLEGAGPEGTREAELAFAEAFEEAARNPAVSRACLPEHGLLDSESLGSLRRRALAEVVGPCASAMLAKTEMAA